MDGKTWDTTHDPWRRISRTSFGIDYLKHYRTLNKSPRPDTDSHEKMMELNCYDKDDNPIYGWDVYVQRLVRSFHAFLGLAMRANLRL